jgi:hypothetical protein
LQWIFFFHFFDIEILEKCNKRSAKSVKFTLKKQNKTKKIKIFSIASLKNGKISLEEKTLGLSC